jgi:hypothetical protein
MQLGYAAAAATAAESPAESRELMSYPVQVTTINCRLCQVAGSDSSFLLVLYVKRFLAALECGGEDCCWFVVDGGRSGRLIGEVAIALDSVLKMLRGLIRPIFLINRLDLGISGW